MFPKDWVACYGFLIQFWSNSKSRLEWKVLVTRGVTFLVKVCSALKDFSVCSTLGDPIRPHVVSTGKPDSVGRQEIRCSHSGAALGSIRACLQLTQGNGVVTHTHELIPLSIGVYKRELKLGWWTTNCMRIIAKKYGFGFTNESWIISEHFQSCSLFFQRNTTYRDDYQYVISRFDFLIVDQHSVVPAFFLGWYTYLRVRAATLMDCLRGPMTGKVKHSAVLFLLYSSTN